MAIKKGLGRGVDLLFNQDQVEEKYFECGIDNIIPNQYQPRSYFDEASLKELADSIAANGIIQPLVVVSNTDGSYGLIAGERRLRASKILGMETVPVVLRDITGDDELLELALIENVQRKDLNPIEEAEAYEKLIQVFSYTQEQAAQKVGKRDPLLRTGSGYYNFLILLRMTSLRLYLLRVTQGRYCVLLRIVLP